MEQRGSGRKVHADVKEQVMQSLAGAESDRSATAALVGAGSRTTCSMRRCASLGCGGSRRGARRRITFKEAARKARAPGALAAARFHSEPGVAEPSIRKRESAKHVEEICSPATTKAGCRWLQTYLSNPQLRVSDRTGRSRRSGAGAFAGERQPKSKSPVKFQRLHEPGRFAGVNPAA